MAQALGAKAASPERQVYCVIGDGAFGFQPQELETAVRNGLKVTYIVLCDKQWGMVKINQQFQLKPLKTLIKGTLSPEETINTDIGEIEWDVLARSMGAHGERVSEPAGLEAALQRALASGKPAVVHVDVDNARTAATKYGVLSVPTILVVKDGQVKEQVIGLLSKSALVDKLNKVL